jgi:ABC-type transport system involved in multi-copper enzyme maturation permease subunit
LGSIDFQLYFVSNRQWAGPVHAWGRRWYVIAEAGIRLLLSYKKFVFVLMLAWIPFFIQAFMLYLILVKGQSLGVELGPGVFQTAFAVQVFPLILVTIYAGSGLIASDLAANALPLYFAKPITRMDYVLGKLAIISAFLILVFLLPVLLLFLFAVGVSPDLTFLRENYWVLGSILGYGLFVVGLTSLFILGLSSTTRSGRVVGVVFIAAVIFSGMMGNILSLVLRSNEVLALSLGHNLTRLADLFFLQEPTLRLHWGTSLAVALLIAAWSVWTLSRRIRPVEVVA